MRKLSWYCLLIFVLSILSCSKDNNSATETNVPSSNYVDVDWNKIKYSFDAASGDIVLPIEECSDIKKHSAIILPDGNYNPIRVVTNIFRDDKSITLHTSDGSLENLFINQRFTLSTDVENSKAISPQQTGNIILPSNIDVIYGSKTSASNSGKGVSYSVSRESMDILPGILSLTGFQSSFDVGFSLSFDFGEKEEDGQKLGDLKDAQISVTGEFDLQSAVAFLKSTIGFSQDLELSILKVRFEFLVGYVPVIVTISPKIGLYGAAETEEKIIINSHYKGSTGYHWMEDKEGECFNDFESSADVFVFDTQKEAQSCNFGVNLNFGISLYESLSFALGFGPKYSVDYRTKEISPGYYGNTNKRTVDWGLNFDIDFSLLKHLQIPLLEVFKPLSSEVLTELPKTIQIINEPQKNLKDGQSAEVSLQIKGIEGDKSTTVPNSLVHFISENGTIDKEYAYSDNNGNVSVLFSLSSKENGSLSVELIGGKGEVIDAISAMQFYYVGEDTPYIPTDEDCIIYYTRPADFPSEDLFLDDSICNRKVVGYCNYSNSEIPENEVGGMIYLDGPVLTITYSNIFWNYVKSLRFPKSCKLVEGGAFMGSLIERVDIQSVEIIGPLAFFASKLKSITLGNSVKEIGDQAFCGCEIENIPEFNEGLERIGMFAFHSCNLMKGTPSFPSTLKTIDDCAFDGCEKLEGTLTIPQSLDTLGIGAFDNCTGLSKVIVPQKFKDQYDKRWEGDSGYYGFEDTVFKNCKATFIYY